MEPIKYPEKIYFGAGDLVTIKHPLPNKPTMLVIGKVTKTIRSEAEKDNYFVGMKCFWFTSEFEYQEQVFNTKDLLHVL